MNYEVLHAALHDEEAMQQAAVVARRIVDDAERDAKASRLLLDAAAAKAVRAKTRRNRSRLYYARVRRREQRAEYFLWLTVLWLFRKQAWMR